MSKIILFLLVLLLLTISVSSYSETEEQEESHLEEEPNLEELTEFNSEEEVDEAKVEMIDKVSEF